MKLTLGFSPCPNDTFLFDAIVNGRLDCGDLTFEVFMADVEQLNRMALQGELDITKVSYHAYAYLRDSYTLLDAGSALGRGCGPLLVAMDETIVGAKGEKATVAIPGKYTTAAFLLRAAYPRISDTREMRFSDIEDAVLGGKADAGVIIHENRFTYAARGLKKIADLGEYWERTTGLPIPLGGIVARQALGSDVIASIEKLLAESIRYAFRNPDRCMEYVRAHAQEMNDAVMRQHIALYVNDYSVSLGKEGREAVEKMMEVIGAAASGTSN